MAIIALACGTALALIVVVVQYSSIAGFEKLVSAAATKFLIRSGITNDASIGKSMGYFNIKSYFRIFDHYWRNQGALLILIPVLFLSALLARGRMSIGILGRRECEIFLVALFPIIMHHLMFFNFTLIHDFSVLKTAVPLSLLLAILYRKNLVFFRRKKFEWGKWALAIMLLLVIVFSVREYYSTNMFNENSYIYLRIGVFIKENTSNDEVLFSTTEFPPPILFYAGRNICHIRTEEEIKEFAFKHNVKKAVVLHLNDEGEIEITRICLKITD